MRDAYTNPINSLVATIMNSKDNIEYLGHINIDSIEITSAIIWH